MYDDLKSYKICLLVSQTQPFTQNQKAWLTNHNFTIKIVWVNFLVGKGKFATQVERAVRTSSRILTKQIKPLHQGRGEQYQPEAATTAPAPLTTKVVLDCPRWAGPCRAAHANGTHLSLSGNQTVARQAVPELLLAVPSTQHTGAGSMLHTKMLTCTHPSAALESNPKKGLEGSPKPTIFSTWIQFNFCGNLQKGLTEEL